MPLLYFARWLTDQAGVSIVADAKLDDAEVSVDVIAVPVSQLLGVVARRLNVQVTRTGDLYFLGNLRAEDRGVLVRKVSRLNGEQLTDAIGVLLSDNGRVQSFDDGLVVVGDGVEILSRVDELLNGVEAAAIDSWVVQLFVVTMTERAERALGFDVIPAVELSTTFALGSGGGNNAYQSLLSGGLDAILTATATTEGASLVADPTFVLVDGGSSKLERVERFPIPVTTVGDESGTRTQDVDFIDIGTIYDVSLRDVGNDRASVTVQANLATANGFINDVPIESAETFSTTAIMASGGVYFLGGVTRQENTDRIEGPFQSLLETQDKTSRLQIWARVYRISGPSHQPKAEPEEPQPIFVPREDVPTIEQLQQRYPHWRMDQVLDYQRWLMSQPPKDLTSTIEIVESFYSLGG